MGNSGPRPWLGGGGPEEAVVDCPSIEMLFKMNSKKATIVTIWGRIIRG